MSPQVRRASLILLASGLSLSAFGQSVALSLTSPQNATTVVPGSTIDWSIDFSVSGGDNQGLALLIVDLEQNANNPSFFDIPHATTIPAAMTNFARPAGITNPGDGAIAGYLGVQRGTAGRLNLVQIGGAQNTFGQARPPGSGVAESATVVPGVGQAGSQLLAAGSFAAPTTCGTYTFNLALPVANVVQQINNPPSLSPVVGATVNVTAGAFTVVVAVTGDLDGNGSVDLTDLSTLLSQFGSTGGTFSADINGDGSVDLTDLSLLLSNFGGTC